MEKEDLKKKKNLLIIGIATLVIVLLGSTYAFFTYSKTIKAFTLTSNSIKAEFQSGTNSINIAYAYPISDSFAKDNLDKLGYLDFTVTGSVADKKEAVTYEIYLTEGSNNTLDSNFIKVYLTDDTNTEVVEPSIYNGLPAPTLTSASDGKVILTQTETGTFESKYRIYAWIEEGYTQNVEHQTFSFKVNLYAYNDKVKTGADTVKEAITSHTTESCNPIIEDTDGTIYFSGTDDCINFNYVWYSGKLWRITAINPDGTMKLITQDQITAISWGADTTYKDSWIYQWLNEDFKDTLYNYENIIVQNADWNATKDNVSDCNWSGCDVIVKPPIDKSATIVQGDVGLLNIYEYYQSNDVDAGYGYLGSDNLWLITPYDDSKVWLMSPVGMDYDSPDDNSFAVRPSINLKSNIQLSGEGTKSNPYTITIDKMPGKKGELINNRLSGEYVKVDNKVYRIVGIENETTKLTSIDYVRDEDGKVLYKIFGSDDNWGTSVTSKNNDYWGYYLNNTWLTNNLKQYITEGTYYLSSDTGSYKNIICSENNTKETTKTCAKTSSIWTGLVGLQRVGEIFQTQIGDDPLSFEEMWLITPRAAMGDKGMLAGRVTYRYPYNEYDAVRPSINLKSEIKIAGGSGTEQDPYTIALPN